LTLDRRWCRRPSTTTPWSGRAPHQLRRARIRHGRHHERRALHGGFIPYGGTFLTFSDYSRNAIRMAALMKLRVVHVFTHDSIGLGEDGPTHQSIEHAASLRLIPTWTSGVRPTPPRPPWPGPWRCATDRPRPAAEPPEHQLRPQGPLRRPRPTPPAWTRSARAPMCWPSRPKSACARRPRR
jgi:hypothetical protein